jgi:hypothetical protein
MLNLIMGLLMLAPAGHAPGPAHVGNGINFGNNNNVSVICNGLCANIPGLSPSPGVPALDAPAPVAPAPDAPAPTPRLPTPRLPTLAAACSTPSTW